MTINRDNAPQVNNETPEHQEKTRIQSIGDRARRLMASAVS